MVDVINSNKACFSDEGTVINEVEILQGDRL